MAKEINLAGVREANSMKSQREQFELVPPTALYWPGAGRKWPAADSGHLFLYDAVNVAGEALEDDWTGDELRALNWLKEPKLIARASSMFAPVRTDFKNPKLVADAENLQKLLSDPSFAKMVKEAKEIWDANQSRINKLKRVCSWLCRHFRDGDVATKTILAAGGSGLSEMKPFEWNGVGQGEKIFANGGFKRSIPGRSVAYDVHVFVQRRSLELALAKPRESVGIPSGILSEIGEDPDLWISPYLHLALEVTKELGITNDDYPSVESVKASIEAKAEAIGLTIGQHGQLSAFAIDRMAMFIRPPEARKGGKRVRPK